MTYTSWNPKYSGKKLRRCLADRMEHAKRFRAMLSELGLSQLQAAKLLHVTLRTLQNWLSGRHEIPYASYKLLRLLRHMELPGDAWRGWSFARGVLITPEGRTIAAHEGAWWSMLVRRSEAFTAIYTAMLRDQVVRAEAQEAEISRPPAMAEGGGRREAPPNLLLEHFRKRESKKSVFPQGVAIKSIAKPSHIMERGHHGA